MRLLVDTQLLLWSAAEPHRLPAAAVELMEYDRHDLFFSVASLWETTIKNGAQRLDFNVDTRRLRQGLKQRGYSELTIEAEHTLLVIPRVHRDPFDRIMIAQAAVEGLTLLTADTLLSEYESVAAIRVV